MPLMMRLRMGKFCGKATVPMGNSETMSPFTASSAASLRFSEGYTTSTPQPSTAMVSPPAASAPLCAAVSMPRAMPLAMVRPACARSAESRSATARP